MNREDIVRMAREAGIANSWDLNWQDKIIERFAALVASAEREACVKAIEKQIAWDLDDPESTAIKAIRARGQA